MTHWRDLPAGPHLRLIIAQRLGWHMRRTWVATDNIAYDFLIYNEDDHLIYQREITTNDLSNETQAVEETWLAAMQDEACPRWDEHLSDTQDLIYNLSSQVTQTDAGYNAWVKNPVHIGNAPTEALALVRAWLAATDPQHHV